MTFPIVNFTCNEADITQQSQFVQPCDARCWLWGLVVSLATIRRALLWSSVCALTLPAWAWGETYTIASGVTDTTQKSVGGTDVVSVQTGGVLSVDDTAIKWNNASTGLVINNAGTIESTETAGRAINAGGDATAPRTVTLNNAAGATIQSQDDAFRVNIDITGGKVTVNNAGTIESTAGGQAIDLDAVSSTNNGQIQINNSATGVIKADDADAIRGGQGTVVTNAGLIYADGAIGGSHDGVDFQEHSGTVINEAGGMISGERHGVVSDTGITVYNAAGATILGRNGSGVNGDGTGYIINYGTITGAYNGSGTGDGDGVNIHGQAYVENFGVINALGAAGLGNDGVLNYSDGITGGANSTIINNAGASVNSQTFGIVAGDRSFIENDGTVTAQFGMFLEGTTKITVVNSGTISGTYAISGGAEDDYLYIEKGSAITGSVDGGAGQNHLFLEAGASFGTATNFQTLQVDGSATLTGDNTFTTTSIAPGAILQLGTGGAAGSVGGAITNNGLLAVDRSDVVTITSPISGEGGFSQIGTGTTVLSVASSYSGLTSVAAGVLEVDGSLSASTVQVLSGSLSGSGSVAGLVGLGGTVSPGESGSIGTLSVNGNAQILGSRLAILIGSNEVSSQLAIQANPATGAAGSLTLGGELSLVAQAGTIPRYGDSYTIATAQGGVTGSFSTVDAVSAILYPAIVSTDGVVAVQLRARSYTSVVNAASPVQEAFAQLLDQSRANYAQMSQLYGALDDLQLGPLETTLEEMAPRAEITAATVARMQQDTLSALYRDRIEATRAGAAANIGFSVIGQPFGLIAANQDRSSMADHTAGDASAAATTVPSFVLPQGLSAFFAGGYMNGSGRALQTTTAAGTNDSLDGWYIAVGGEAALSDRLTVGASVAYVQGEGDILRAREAKDSLTQFTAYGSLVLPLGLFVDGQFGVGPDNVRTSRSFTTSITSYDLTSHVTPTSETAEFELGKDLRPIAGLVITPLAGLRYAHLGFNSTSETGGDAALTYAGHDVDSFESRLGFTAKSVFQICGLEVKPKLDAAYVHDFDADREDFGAQFLEGAGPYANFDGPDRSKDWAEVGGGATISGKSVAVSLNAETSLGRNDLNYQTYSASVTVKF